MLLRPKRPAQARLVLCALVAVVVPTPVGLGADGFAPVPTAADTDPQVTIAALGARATQVAELTRDAADRGTGRESGPFVALVTVSMLSSLGVGIVALRRRRLGEPASVRTSAPTVAGSSPPSPA